MNHMIPNELNFSDEEISEYVADFCFNVTKNKKPYELAIRWLIEFIALPDDCKGYTKNDLKKHILKEIGNRYWRNRV